MAVLAQNTFTFCPNRKLGVSYRRKRPVQGRRANKKLARGEVPPLLLKIDAVVGLETAFAFLKMAPDS